MLVRVSPSEWVVRVGWGGRLISASQGASFWSWPWETSLRFPSTIQWMLFSASQITRENQGVDVKGAFSWRVVDPLKAYRNLNMAAMPAAEVKELMGTRSSTAEAGSVDHGPLMRTTLLIRQLAESVTRNAIANMSLDEALRDRRSIVDTLSHQIDSVIGPWGVAITSIEIVDVYITSTETFANMQAEYRERMRREAKVAQLGTDEDIAHRQLATQSRLATVEHDRAMVALTLKAEREAREIEVQQEVDQRRQAVAAELALARIMAEAEQEKAATEQRLERQRLEQALVLERRRASLELTRQRIEILGQGNEAYRTQQLLQSLPALAQSMKADKTTVFANTLGGNTVEGLLASVAGLADTVGLTWPRPKA